MVGISNLGNPYELFALQALPEASLLGVGIGFASQVADCDAHFRLRVRRAGLLAFRVRLVSMSGARS